MTDDRRRVGLALVVGILLHAGLGVAVYTSPEPEPDPIAPKRMKVQIFNRDVTLPKPKPPPPPKPPEPPPTPPEPPKLEPIEPVEVSQAKPEPKPQPKAAPKKAPRPKPKQRQAKRPAKKPVKTIRTIRRSNLGGDSPIKAYEGSADTFGSPEERPTPENEQPDPGPRGDGPQDFDGTARTGGTEDPAPTRSRPPVPPKVLEKVQGQWPDAAPRGKRPISLTLTLRIDESGRVVSARVRSKPPAAGKFFDQEAIRVAKATRFQPATQDGKPIAFTIRYVVRFTP